MVETIFISRKDGAIRAQNEELHNLYASHNIVRAIASRKPVLVGCVKRKGKIVPVPNN